MSIWQTLLNGLNLLSLPLGRWFGVPVTLHWSWTLFFLYLLATAPAQALVFAALFLIVLLHECGHCLAARWFKAPADSIVLYPFGGAANVSLPPSAKAEFWIAIAGPLVNLLLVPVLLMLAPFSDTLAMIGFINVGMLIFNLLPAFPMDGGRILRSFLAGLTGKRVLATTIAVRVSQVMCVLFVAGGLITGHLMLMLVGLLVFAAAEFELQSTKDSESTSRIVPPDWGTQIHSNPDVAESARMVRSMQARMDRLERRSRRDR
jgi:Zn-dependent protease